MFDPFIEKMILITSISKENFDKLLDLISSANDTCVLIIAFNNIDFDSKKGAKEKGVMYTVKLFFK